MDNLKFSDDNTSFWLELKNREVDEKTGKSNVVSNGRLRIQIEIHPVELARQNPVGQAREEPNVNPYLPLPVGRMTLSLNPLKMLNQLVGPGLRRKLYTYCCIALCVAACIFLGPAIAAFF